LSFVRKLEDIEGPLEMDSTGRHGESRLTLSFLWSQYETVNLTKTPLRYTLVYAKR
jgi:hypothetical protein